MILTLCFIKEEFCLNLRMPGHFNGPRTGSSCETNFTTSHTRWRMGALSKLSSRFDVHGRITRNGKYYNQLTTAMCCLMLIILKIAQVKILVMKQIFRLIN